MGYGQKLKSILDERNMSVRQLAKTCNIAPTTLYSIVQRDTDIRYDFALRIANALDIPVASICSELPYDAESTLPNLPTMFGEEYNKKAYFSNRTLEIAKLFNYEEFPMLDKLIEEFYVLEDEARKEIFKIIEMKHETHDNPKRVENLKKIK
ncbi:MAG: helix-turn-helix domain-containing protein [Agathobacter sp.]